MAKTGRLLLFFLAALLGCSAAALATGPVHTAPGHCPGGGAMDCTSSVGHDSVSIASLLTINEQRAINFGNMTVSCNMVCDGTASVDLGIDGSRTYHPGTNDQMIMLVGVAGTGFQSPGHYTVEGAQEGNATQVYISFSDISGNPIDIKGDNNYPGTVATLTGPSGQTFTMNQFVINESGHDVYGHYIDNRGGAYTPAPGSATPFDHSRTPSPLDIDVVVGATLHTVAGVPAYPPGKYIGTFNVLVSY